MEAQKSLNHTTSSDYQPSSPTLKSTTMRPRLPIRRILLLRPFRPPNSPRPLSQNVPSRPQLPFLASSTNRPVARFITTETKQWLKREVGKGLKYTLIIYTIAGLGVVIAYGVRQEWLDRKYPSPHEWSWWSRKKYRAARFAEDSGTEDEPAIIDWARSGGTYRLLLERLEDPNLDGVGLLELDEGGILVEGVGKTGYDLSNKPETWRRGYYETLMGLARAAEHLDGWVRDKTRDIAFPANVVIGPSNPNPRPVPPNAHTAPKEEDCEIGFDPPEVYYMRILTTQGFTEKQRVDAALAYGTWLDYKSTPEAATEMFRWALDIATADSPGSVDVNTGILNTKAGTPSANILTATTAFGVHYATNQKLNDALPIFLAILRARRALPTSPATMLSTLNPDGEEDTILKAVMRLIKSAMVAPKYPPPPSDGKTPPERSAKERCEEAAIMTYIGEILYASKTSKTSKDDGLAWTREAVDIAEEELMVKAVEKQAKETCKECLRVGLDNWSVMVAKMAKAEKEAKASVGRNTSWLGFGGEQKDVVGRWESEEQVVRDRVTRSREILLAKEKPQFGFGLV